MRRDTRLTAISFVADAVNRTIDLKEIADNALHAILAVMELDAGAVYLWQEREGELRLFAWRGISEAFARQATAVRKGDDAVIDAVLEGATQVIDDFQLSARLFRFDAVSAGFSAAVLTPIRVQGLVVGLLALGSYKTREFGRDDLELIDVIASQIGIAMVHAQLEADLRAAEAQARSLLENSDDAIYITDLQGRPRFANAAFQRVFGFTPEELATQDPMERIHPADVDAVQRAFGKLLLGEPAHNIEYRFQRKDGQWVDLQCSANVFAHDGGNVTELQFVVREVTQARQRHQQLLRRNRQLSALTMIARVANSSLNIREIARNTLEVALESTGMDGGGIHLADPVAQRMDLYLQIGLPDDFVEELRALAWGEGVAGTVIATGQPKVFTDLAAEAPMARRAALRHKYKALIVVPVKEKERVLGTLGLISKREMEFTPELVETISAMGNELGIALANAQLYEAQVRENEKLNALLEVSGGSAQRLELEALLRRILSRSAALMTADGAYMVQYEPQANRAVIVAASAIFENLVGVRFDPSHGLFGQILPTRQGRIFSREEVAQYDPSPPLLQANLRSVLVVPLMSRNKFVGTVLLARRADATGDFTAADLDLMEAFASRAGMAIDNAQLLDDLEQKNKMLELLVEEAHHRIKNNLQMISGLLELQAQSAGGDSADYLRTATARIQAIAHVHNLLSEEMPEQVDARALITTIVNTVVSSAHRARSSSEVTLKLEQFGLGAEQAVPLALIVNELVSNSLLHSAPADGAPLRLLIQCAQSGNQVQLVVADNGGGFREPQNLREDRGQGIDIVKQLAQVNLRGTLQIGAHEDGVRAELRFGLAGPADSPATTIGAMAHSGS